MPTPHPPETTKNHSQHPPPTQPTPTNHPQIQNRITHQTTTNPNELTPNPLNARTHPTRQRQALNQILTTVGWVQTVIVNENTGRIVDGHLRVEEAIQQGATSIPVTYVNLTENEEQTLLAVLDPISALAGYDVNILTQLLKNIDIETGTALDELVNELAATAAEAHREPFIRGDPDDLPTITGDEPVTQPGDRWVLTSPTGLVHEVLCGDALTDIPSLVGDRTPAMMWTDPPYGVAYEGKTRSADRSKTEMTIQNDALTPTNLLPFLATTLGAAVATLPPGGPVYVAAPGNPVHQVFGQVLGDMGVWRQTLAWVKQMFVMGRSDYHYRHEPIFYGWKPGAKHVWCGGRTLDSVLEFDRPQKSVEHPTMKPVALVAHCITNSSNPFDTILDPFGGSGTTLIACEQENRQALLLEKDPVYVDVICTRWQHLTDGTITRNGEKHYFGPDEPDPDQVT